MQCTASQLAITSRFTLQFAHVFIFLRPNLSEIGADPHRKRLSFFALKLMESLMTQLANIIEQAFEDRLKFSPSDAPQDVRDAVAEALAGLDNGSLRVAEKIN